MSEPRVTHPTTFTPSALAAGESYATVAQILECDDLPQATLHIPHWRIGGSAAAIRVRALSLEERETVQKIQGVADQYCRIWQYGCINPPFTQEQAEALRRKNPSAVEQGAQFMLLLSAIDQDWIDHVVQQQTGAEAQGTDDEQGAPADTDTPARVRRVA